MTNQEAKEYKRQEIVNKAMSQVASLVVDGSDGTREETNYLMATIAAKIMHSALNPFIAAMLTKDLEDPTRNERTSQ